MFVCLSVSPCASLGKFTSFPDQDHDIRNTVLSTVDWSTSKVFGISNNPELVLKRIPWLSYYQELSIYLTVFWVRTQFVTTCESL